MVVLGALFRKVREALALSSADVCRYAGIAEDDLHDYELGRRVPSGWERLFDCLFAMPKKSRRAKAPLVSPLLTRIEAAAYLRLSIRSFARLDVEGIRIGGGSRGRVFYTKEMLDAWIARKSVEVGGSSISARPPTTTVPPRSAPPGRSELTATAAAFAAKLEARDASRSEGPPALSPGRGGKTARDPERRLSETNKFARHEQTSRHHGEERPMSMIDEIAALLLKALDGAEADVATQPAPRGRKRTR